MIAASQDGHTEVVKVLIEHGAEVDLQKNDGVSALMIASGTGHVNLLHEHGAQVDLQNNE